MTKEMMIQEIHSMLVSCEEEFYNNSCFSGARCNVYYGMLKLDYDGELCELDGIKRKDVAEYDVALFYHSAYGEVTWEELGTLSSKNLGVVYQAAKEMCQKMTDVVIN